MATVKIATGWGIVYPGALALLLGLMAPSLNVATIEGLVMLGCVLYGAWLMASGLSDRRRLGAAPKEVW